jgi:hypothetical protein
MMKADVPEEETATCKNEGNKASCPPVTHSFLSGRPIFGGTGKLGNHISAVKPLFCVHIQKAQLIATRIVSDHDAQRTVT